MAPYSATFTHVSTGEPHRGRARQLLSAHPEARGLMTKAPVTFGIIMLCLVAQVLLAALLAPLAWYWWLLAAYFVGAFFSHTLFVTIHEAAHNLIFRKGWQNAAAGIIANLPTVVPTAMSFKNFHLQHHVHQGVHELDADLPDWYEAKLIRNYALGKAVWLFFFPLFQVIRTLRCREVVAVDRLVVVNFVVQLAFNAAIVYFLGWPALLYLFMSFWFSVGLHPLGARWIQEHYLTLDPEQETYSYYGRMNGLNLNVGFHNEHHDLPAVPWTRLPALKALAPEFYEPLLHHTSYTRLFFRFLFDQEISLYSRITRPRRAKKTVTSAAR